MNPTMQEYIYHATFLEFKIFLGATRGVERTKPSFLFCCTVLKACPFLRRVCVYCTPKQKEIKEISPHKRSFFLRLEEPIFDRKRFD